MSSDDIFSYGCTHYVLLCCSISANKVFSKTVVHSVSLEGNSRLSVSVVLVCRWLVEVLLYVHRNRKFIRDGSPGSPPRLSHSS